MARSVNQVRRVAQRAEAARDLLRAALTWADRACGVKITNPILIERCRKALANGDKHLNSIPLKAAARAAAGTGSE